MHEIERIKTLRKSVAVARNVLVAVFTSNLPNRVRAGISPALPTPPSMRVRTRRLKQGNENVSTDL